MFGDGIILKVEEMLENDTEDVGVKGWKEVEHEQKSGTQSRHG